MSFFAAWWGGRGDGIEWDSGGGIVMNLSLFLFVLSFLLYWDCLVQESVDHLFERCLGHSVRRVSWSVCRVVLALC